MYIPRSLFAAAYSHLKSQAYSSTSSVLIFCALDTDSLCAARILVRLFQNDYIEHQIHPVAGYQDLERLNGQVVKGKEGLRFVICLGLGGLVDLSAFLELPEGAECWIVDGRRPWNLYNVYGGADEKMGKVSGGRYGVGELGGIKCFDDGDIEEDMAQEGEAFKALIEMPEVDDDSDSEGEDESEDEDGGGVRISETPPPENARKRKSSDEPGDSDDEDGSRTRRQRRDSDASSGPSTPRQHRHTLLSHPSSRPLASSPPPAGARSPGSPSSQQLPEPPALQQPSAKALRRKLRHLRYKHESTVADYYSQGTWYGEPISGLLYSLASDLGREDNDLLWFAIVGVCAGEIYGRSITSGPPLKGGGGYGAGSREEQIRGVLRDEVRRLNPPDAQNAAPTTSLQTTARSPQDTAIRISPEYRFMMIRHWSLYDSMLHSSYLGTKLHIWSEGGRKRLHKLLAKMGFSLNQCKQHYTHMDMDLKRSLRDKLERFAPLYGLDGIVKEGFVRCWGWRGCLSAADVGYVVGGILEIGKTKKVAGNRSEPEVVSAEEGRLREQKEEEEWVTNFWDAYDALANIEFLKSALPTAMELHRAILRTGTALIEKRQIRHLRAFRLAVLKEGPDLPVFSHPNALSKLGLWISEAIIEQEREHNKKKHLPLVVASLNERRGIYIVVGMALGEHVANTARIQKKKEREARKKEKEKKQAEKEVNLDDDGEEKEEEEEEEESDDDSEDEEERRGGRNRFGIAFQDVANSTQARIRIDSFEATVVEVKKEDLAGFLEGLSLRSVIG